MTINLLALSHQHSHSLQSINLNGNKLKGTVPPTLVNCQPLQGIDIGNNEIRGAFPFWMETLPELRILVLKSNKFNGTISIEQSFPKLQVLDVSHNALVGSLPDRYFKNFRGMIDAKENQTYDEGNMFPEFIDLKVTLKGLDQLLQQLLDTFTTIDLSSNKFSGSIPPSLGNLNSLRYLNLSHNILTGHITPLLGGMSLLESMDLSSNKLNGEIPELCGVPLTKKCDREIEWENEEVESDREIEWDYVFAAAAGYVVGLGSFSWLLLFCRSFRYKYFEKVEDVFEKIFECCQRRKKRDRRRRVARNQVRRQC
ncbi:receptor-like protein 19 [Salvia splendens]|uniref:receptor-like protein 19 n=1 Tax=Salvia splendens TaxID=180675 RepID=UPI001C26B442|nr:receptor-like protein 19 [Salvia splendens]